MLGSETISALVRMRCCLHVLFDHISSLWQLSELSESERIHPETGPASNYGGSSCRPWMLSPVGGHAWGCGGYGIWDIISGMGRLVRKQCA